MLAVKGNNRYFLYESHRTNKRAMWAECRVCTLKPHGNKLTITCYEGKIRRNWPVYGLPMSLSPTLFSGSGPVGLPPVPWTKKKNNWKVAIFRPTRRSLLPRRPGWTDNILNIFWVACKSYNNGLWSVLSFVGSVLNKSQVWSLQLVSFLVWLRTYQNPLVNCWQQHLWMREIKVMLQVISHAQVFSSVLTYFLHFQPVFTNAIYLHTISCKKRLLLLRGRYLVLTDRNVYDTCWIRTCVQHVLIQHLCNPEFGGTVSGKHQRTCVLKRLHTVLLPPVLAMFLLLYDKLHSSDIIHNWMQRGFRRGNTSLML